MILLIARIMQRPFSGRMVSGGIPQHRSVSHSAESLRLSASTVLHEIGRRR